MASLSNSRSVWFTTLLIFLFFWNILHNSDTLVPPQIEVIEEIPQEKTVEVEVEDFASNFPDPPQLEIYEPELPVDSDTGEDDYSYARPPVEIPTVPSDNGIKPLDMSEWDGKQYGADGYPVSSTNLFDISPPDAALDPTVPVDPIISDDTHQGNTQAENPQTNSHAHDRPLVLYSYTETPEAHINLEFFIKHGLQSTSDFMFIFNGSSDAINLFPSPMPTNIRTVDRQSECYDFGAQAQLLLENDSDLARKYGKFILMNADVRGPFLPSWSKQCWTEGYLGKLTDTVKLVGMSYDCHGGQNRLQSSFWALDSEGLNVLLTSEGINECYQSPEAARLGEIRALSLLKAKGYQVEVMAQPEVLTSAENSDSSSSEILTGSDSPTLESVSTIQGDSAATHNITSSETSTTTPIEDAVLEASGKEENTTSATTDAKIPESSSAISVDGFGNLKQIAPVEDDSVAGSHAAQSNVGPGTAAAKGQDDGFGSLADNVEEKPSDSEPSSIGLNEKPQASSSPLTDSNLLLDFDSGSAQQDSPSPSIPPTSNSIPYQEPPSTPSDSDTITTPLTSEKEDISDEELAEENAKAAANPAYLDPPSLFTEDEIRISRLTPRLVERGDEREIGIERDGLDGLEAERLGDRVLGDGVLSGGTVECLSDYEMLHPYATMFVRTRMDGAANGESEVVRKLTEEHDARGVSSYDVCS